MTAPDDLLVFTIDDQRYAIALSIVDRVIRMVWITHLPKAPDGIAGIINVHGSIVPVFTLRERFGHPMRRDKPGDQLIIVRTKQRRVALPVDCVSGVISIAKDLVDADDFLPSHPYVRGVVKLPDGLILIHEPDTFLSIDEEVDLCEALIQGGGVR